MGHIWDKTRTELSLMDRIVTGVLIVACENLLKTIADN